MGKDSNKRHKILGSNKVEEIHLHLTKHMLSEYCVLRYGGY